MFSQDETENKSDQKQKEEINKQRLVVNLVRNTFEVAADGNVVIIAKQKSKNPEDPVKASIKKSTVMDEKEKSNQTAPPKETSSEIKKIFTPSLKPPTLARQIISKQLTQDKELKTPPTKILPEKILIISEESKSKLTTWRIPKNTPSKQSKDTPQKQCLEEDNDVIIIDDSEDSNKRCVKSFYCNKCGFFCDDFTKLHNHIFKTSYSDHKFRCANCRYVVGKTLAELMIHTDKFCNRQLFNTSEEQLEQENPGVHRYYCELCGKGVGLLAYLLKHYEEHSNELLGCSLCNKKAYNFMELLFHFRDHTVVGNIHLPCKLCPLEFYASRPAKLHYYTVHPHMYNVPFECDLCLNVIFDDEDKFLFHVQGHSKVNSVIKPGRPVTDVTTLTCEVCAKIFSSNAERKRHKNTEHPSEVNAERQCRECKMQITVSGIASHLLFHQQQKAAALPKNSHQNVTGIAPQPKESIQSFPAKNISQSTSTQAKPNRLAPQKKPESLAQTNKKKNESPGFAPQQKGSIQSSSTKNTSQPTSTQVKPNRLAPQTNKKKNESPGHRQYNSFDITAKPYNPPLKNSRTLIDIPQSTEVVTCQVCKQTFSSMLVFNEHMKYHVLEHFKQPSHMAFLGATQGSSNVPITFPLLQTRIEEPIRNPRPTQELQFDFPRPSATTVQAKKPWLNITTQSNTTVVTSQLQELDKSTGADGCVPINPWLSNEPSIRKSTGFNPHVASYGPSASNPDFLEWSSNGNDDDDEPVQDDSTSRSENPLSRGSFGVESAAGNVSHLNIVPPRTPSPPMRQIEFSGRSSPEVEESYLDNITYPGEIEIPQLYRRSSPREPEVWRCESGDDLRRRFSPPTGFRREANRSRSPTRRGGDRSSYHARREPTSHSRERYLNREYRR